MGSLTMLESAAGNGKPVCGLVRACAAALQLGVLRRVRGGVE